MLKDLMIEIPKQEIIYAWKDDGDSYEPEIDGMLKILLLNDVLIVNSFWFKKDWDEEQRRMTSLSVNCSDVFAWGSADAEEMSYSEIVEVFDHWLKDNKWGPAVWCIKKRLTKPQEPVYNEIMKGGMWDLDGILSTLQEN